MTRPLPYSDSEKRPCRPKRNAYTNKYGRETKVSGHLVLNVDDFVIKKGHTYNTGIHNLRGEMMPDVLPGRKLDDLRAYTSQHPDLRKLEPYAVGSAACVM